tara:strand:+ start:2381 stop:3301 length:921 start_codon:yes stop_codon:yes gene_type:complete
VKKILIIKHGSLGDIALALPAFASIKKHFNKSKIFLLTEKKYFNFFKKSPYIDKCIEDNRSKNLLKTFEMLNSLLTYKFNFLIDLQNSKRTSLYNLFFKIFSKSIISSSRGFSNFRYKIPIQGTETVISGLFNQLKLINVKRNKKENYSWLSVKLKDKYKKPLALFIPGVSKRGNYKQLEPIKFARIAKYLESLNYMICVIGNKEDEKSIKPILESCNNVINKTGNSPPEIIYSIALKSKIIFSNDTGPGHIAALAKKNFVYVLNNNSISKSNISKKPHIFKIQSKSVKNISSNQIINFIKKNKLF